MSASSVLIVARSSSSPPPGSSSRISRRSPARASPASRSFQLAVCRHRGPEQSAERHRAAVVQVRVVLPGVADAAEDLNALVHARDGRVGREYGGGRRREVAPWLIAGECPCRIPDRRRRLLGHDEHPRAPVLDRLELADRPAELMADLGVFGGRVHCPVGDTESLGAEDDSGDVRDRFEAKAS